jgi:outer membrane protein OmpA-like peptidoglycan-associated protein
MNQYLSTLALAIAAAAATLMAPQAKAEKVVVYREGQLVDPQDVADVLGQTRSIRLLDEPPAAAPAAAQLTPVAAVSMQKTSASAPAPAPAPGARAKPAPEAASALSLPVRFAFDSADILPDARTQLDALAKGIKMLPRDRTVTVEGHTDATGGEGYNMALSRARAQSVRDYLVQHHGIDAARLKTVGYGKDRPIEGSDPHAALNRRVQFRGS